jgi:hypothetical protein
MLVPIVESILSAYRMLAPIGWHSPMADRMLATKLAYSFLAQIGNAALE